MTGLAINQTIRLEIELDRYRHRTWNHICWYFSSKTGINRLYYNGRYVGSRTVLNLPLVEGSLGAYDHHFIIGQEPDKIRGAFEEDQAFFGSISELNVWNTSLSSTMIRDLAECRRKDRGNIVAWEKSGLLRHNVAIEDVKTISDFCESDPTKYVIFAEKVRFSEAESHQSVVLFVRFILGTMELRRVKPWLAEK